MREPRRNMRIKIRQDENGQPVVHAFVAEGDKVQFVGEGKGSTLSAEFKSASPFVDDKDNVVTTIPFNSESVKVQGLPRTSYDFTVVATTDNPGPTDLIRGQIDIDP